MRILIIDDREDSRDTIKNELNQLDLKIELVGESANGKDIIPFFKEEQQVELVLLDKKFGSDWTRGFEIARYIKHQLSPNVKIVLLTEFQSKLEFIEIHSSGLIDGYLKKSNLLNQPKLKTLLLCAMTGHPLWDVPKDWLNYALQDNLEHYRQGFARLLGIRIEEVNAQSEDFKKYLIDEKLRLSTGPPPQTLTSTEWRLFKMAAMGYSKEKIIETLEIGAYHVFLGNIRSKLGFEHNYNKAMFLVHALKMQIPEVVERVEELSACRIIYE